MKFNLSRKIKYQTNAITLTLLILAILVAINFISYQYYWRLDLTQNKVYSLSDTSKDILTNLDDVVNVKVYFSEKLPSEYLSVKQGVEDMLDEYKNYSGNKIKVEYIDPVGDPELEQEVAGLGIPALQFNVMERDQFQLINGYLGMAINYADQQQIIPVVDSTKNLEYDLTSSVVKVTQTESIKIAWFAKEDAEAAEAALFQQDQGEYSVVLEELRDQYQVQKISATQEELLTDDTDALVVVSSDQAFSEREQFVIDQFLIKGKNVIFLVDGVTVNQYLLTSANSSGILGLLEHYGVKVDNNLVLDVSNEVASFSGGYVSFMVNYPFWVKVLNDNFNQDNTAVSQLENLVLPWTSSVSLLENKLGGNSYSVLAKSTEMGWLSEGDNIDLNPQQQFMPTEYGQYNLAVEVQGSFTSYWQDKEVPASSGEEMTSADEFIPSTDNGHIVVIGDADLVTDRVVSRFPDNLLFFQNVLDSMVLEQSLAAIRSKGVVERPLKPLSDNAKSAIKYLNIFGVTLLAAVFGLVKFYLRKKKKKLSF